MAKITVITSTYNRSCLLKRCIESVLNSSFSDFEYVIINNGSTDDTQDVIEDFMRTDSRIRCVRNEVNSFKGKVPSRDDEFFVETDENKFYTGVDDDDYIDKDMLYTLYHLAVDTGSDICSVGSKWVFPDGSQKNKYVYEGMYTVDRIGAMVELLKREKINNGAPGRLYRKRMMYKIDYPDVPRIRDIHREYRIFNRIETTMTMTGKPMYYYCRNDNNLSGLNTGGQITQEKMDEHLYANHIRTKYLTEKMPEISDFALYSEYSFMISLTKRIRDLAVIDCYSIADKMSRTLQIHKEWLLECGYLKPHEQDYLISL